MSRSGGQISVYLRGEGCQKTGITTGAIAGTAPANRFKPVNPRFAETAGGGVVGLTQQQLAAVKRFGETGWRLTLDSPNPQ